MRERRFLLGSGLVLAAISAATVLLLSGGRARAILVMTPVPPLVAAAMHGLPPLHFVPGDSFRPWLWGVAVPLPAYLLVLWTGAWVIGATRTGRNPVWAGALSAAGFVAACLTVMWLVSLR